MKKILNLTFALAMIMSVAFIGEAVSSGNNPYSVKAQTVTVKKRRPGVIRSVYRGGKYVGKQVWNGTKWVSSKTWQGTKYAGRKTVQGTRYAAHKTKRGTKAVISRTKKIVY
jgi:hypothetical protein